MQSYEYPKGMKVIDEWIDLAGYRMFMIYETDDEKDLCDSSLPFHRDSAGSRPSPVMNARRTSICSWLQELAGKAGEKGVEATALVEGAVRRRNP